MSKFIFITGGVTSSLGKGLASAALGSLLQARGYTVKLRKLDPYLNIDPGTMSPYQHGEVFVTEDGMETDLDLGHYERFTGVNCLKSDYVTTGQTYSKVLAKERRGEYLGATVQVIPHITDEIKNFITGNTDNVDFVLCEIGGTVGDIEGLPYLEAIRQLRIDLGRRETMFIHLTLLPYIPTAGELKTKPTQHSVKELLSVGIQPDILLCRSDREIPADARRKLALFCNVESDNVIAALDASNIYEVPLNYHHEGFDRQVCRYFNLPDQNQDLSRWTDIMESINHPTDTVRIGIVGKYVQLLDAYKSLIQALAHGGIHHKLKPELIWIDSEDVAELHESLKSVHAILVPGGFGERGTEGKLKAIQYARENKIPYFGICFGMQLAVIETCRNLLGLKNASTTEFGPTTEPVVGLMTEWARETDVEKRDAGSDLGGTMRLGSYECHLTPGSIAHKAYGKDIIHERHRHRYEVNMTYRDKLSSAHMEITGLSPDGKLPEIIERKDHPWFLAVQFHPELKSRPFEPHPIFASFIKAAHDKKRGKL